MAHSHVYCHCSLRSFGDQLHHRKLRLLVFVYLLLYLAAAPAAARPQRHAGLQQKLARCGTHSDPGSWQYKQLIEQQALLSQQQNLDSTASIAASSWFPELPLSRRSMRQQTPTGRSAKPSAALVYTVPTYVHVIAVRDEGVTSANVSRPVIDQQLVLLNKAFSEKAIRSGPKWQFQLANVTYHTSSRNRDLCEAHSGKQLKQRLRRGGQNTLNIYITDLSNCGVLGVSTWPWEVDKSSDGLALDGVVVHYGALPGGDYAPYNKGGTAVHETGHWLGLLHTFENGCVPPGDGVDDTPYCTVPDEMYCPKRRDSCPQPGDDPVNNWMGYGVDECMKEFTPGQLRRMEQLWLQFRAS